MIAYTLVAARRCVSRRSTAFSLIEIMIVVAILGILAAIAAPKFFDMSEQARATSVSAQLQTIRKQIEVHNFENPGVPFNPLVPGGAAAWNQLVNNGHLSAAPANPMQLGSTKVAPVPMAGFGWVWADPMGTGANVYAVNEAGGFYDGDGNGQPD